MALESNHWLKLRLLSLAPLTVIEATDQTGQPPRIVAKPYSLSKFSSPWLSRTIKAASRSRFGRSGVTPIFLDTISDLDFFCFGFERMLGLHLSEYPVVWWSRTPWESRPPITLPLKVAAVGRDASEWIGDLKGSSWANDKDVQTHGLVIQTGPDPAPILHAFSPHIVVAKTLDQVLEIAARLPGTLRPRLFVWFDETMNSEAPALMRSVISGVAMLRIGAISNSQMNYSLKTLGLEFTHDKPLHEIAMEINKNGSLPVCLTADPFSLQGLRLSEAVRFLRREAQTIESQYTESRAHEISSWIARSAMISDFLREKNAFLPMASLMRGRDAVHSGFRAAMAWAKEENRAAGPPIFAPSPRSVQVTVERLDSEPFLSAVTPQTALGAGLTYQLRVEISLPFPSSLVEQSVPIDPVLGQPDHSSGYDLEVAVQGKDFDILSERSLCLFLPKLGASAPVYFEIRAPERAQSAELRVCVYHQNHLVQSYILKASVKPKEVTGRKKATTVVLELARTGSWSDVNNLGARMISLGVNASSGGTHNLIIKSTATAEEVSLKASTFNDAVMEIRNVLAAAAKDQADPSLAKEYPILVKGQQPTDDVAETIRKLTAWGIQLYGAFFARVVLGDSPMRGDLVRLASSSGEAIQVVRFAYEDVFPWALLYDWDRPSDDGAAVCLGWTRGDDGRTTPCDHRSNSSVYCVRGFWGVRHRVEEVLRQPEGYVKSVAHSAKGPAIRVVADGSLSGGQTLINDLAARFGHNNVALGPNEPKPLLDILFDNPDIRPSLLILLGHHERLNRPIGGLLSRLQIDDKPEWLSEEDVRFRMQKQPSSWAQPRSVVLLMACESAITGLTTLTDFVTTWNVSGAGAIIGTESVVGSKLAADFAQRFAHRMWNDKETLGSAMMGIRGEFLAEGNPLAFLFHAVGDLDLNLS